MTKYNGCIKFICRRPGVVGGLLYGLEMGYAGVRFLVNVIHWSADWSGSFEKQQHARRNLWSPQAVAETSLLPVWLKFGSKPSCSEQAHRSLFDCNKRACAQVQQQLETSCWSGMCVTAFCIRPVYVVIRHQLLYKFVRSGCVVGLAMQRAA